MIPTRQTALVSSSFQYLTKATAESRARTKWSRSDLLSKQCHHSAAHHVFARQKFAGWSYLTEQTRLSGRGTKSSPGSVGPRHICRRALDLFLSPVACACWHGSVLARSTSHKQLPAHGVCLGNWISYFQFAILLIYKAFPCELCENVSWFLLIKNSD